MRTLALVSWSLTFVGCASSPTATSIQDTSSVDSSGDSAKEVSADTRGDSDAVDSADGIAGDSLACVTIDKLDCSEASLKRYKEGRVCCPKAKSMCSSTDCRIGSYDFDASCNTEGWVSYVETPCEPPWEFGDSGPDGSDFGKD